MQEGEVQRVLMSVIDANGQRTEVPSIIPAGSHTIYPATGTATTMVPIPFSVPQYPAAARAPMYPANQVIYSTDQFTPGGATIAATAAPANGQLQQIPTYPSTAYSYPYNGNSFT